jgi:hypothetical protein
LDESEYSLAQALVRHTPVDSLVHNKSLNLNM